jgi:hypothetical protein
MLDIFLFIIANITELGEMQMLFNAWKLLIMLAFVKAGENANTEYFLKRPMSALFSIHPPP